MKKKTGAKTLKDLSDWDWTTLVAAWRYYEHRSTIAASMFPADIVERFWSSGKWSKHAQNQIARQFALVDHYSSGEDDWPMNDGFGGIDAKPWRKFYGFCHSFATGRFVVVSGEVDGKEKKVDCFRACGRLYPVEYYIANPHGECYADESRVKIVE